MSCANPSSRKWLDQLFTGELGDEDLKALRAHAASCAACHAEYDKLTRARARLEKAPSGLPADRLEFLQRQVVSRVKPERKSWWTKVRFWVAPAVGLAVAAAMVAVLVPRVQTKADAPEWQARGGATANGDAAFGVRAFCVSRAADAKVHAEAGPGESLSCPPGMAVQFTYTAPRAAKLTISAPTVGGDWLAFLPAADPQSNVKAGSDVALSFSTEVTSDWLSAPLEVRAQFADPHSGKVLAQSLVQLVPEVQAPRPARAPAPAPAPVTRENRSH